MIPARYAASRFPGKLMQKLGDHTVIATVYLAAKETELFDDVIVVTDSDIIYDEIRSVGGQPMRSKKEHESGTDRIAEVAESMDVDIILNVQGDTPFIKKEPLLNVSIFPVVVSIPLNSNKPVSIRMPL